MRILSFREIILIITGFLILSSMVFSFTDPKKNPLGIGSDSYEFWHLSTNILEHKTFSYTDLTYYPLFFLGDNPPPELVNQSVPCTTRVPGYSLLLALARGVWNSPNIAIGLNMLSYMGICLYGFLLGRMLFPVDKQRLIYNIFLTLSPLYFIRWGVGADYVASFYVTGFAFHLLKIIQTDSKSIRHIFGAALFGLLAVLTRPNLLVFTTGLTILLIMTALLKKHDRYLSRLFIVLLIMMLGTNSWMERNKNLTGQRILSTQNGSVLYTVHLSPHIDETRPLYKWSKQQRRELFIEHLRTGKTFNQSEAIINDQTKSVSMNFLKENPALLLTNTINGLRTFFLFSYYDISDILIYALRPMADRLHYLETEHYQSINPFENLLRQCLFQISRVYKICLAFGFLAFPLLIVFKKVRSGLPDLTMIMSLYLTTMLSVLSTAFFTGAGGDRLRMPFNAFILMFAVFFWCHLFPLKSKKIPHFIRNLFFAGRNFQQ